MRVPLIRIGNSRGIRLPKAVIVSPDELNTHLRSVIVVPLTRGKAYPFRVRTKVGGKAGMAAVDQVRTVDKGRLVQRVGTVVPRTGQVLLRSLAHLFAE